MVYSIKKIIALLIVLLSSSVVLAQDPVCRTINKQNGLPSNTVYNLLQDKQGFIWLGHDKGLSKYDGQSFVNYQSPSQQGKSLSNLVEAGNSIWCKDFAGNIYYTHKDSLKKEQHLNSIGSYITGTINNNITAVDKDSIHAVDVNTHTKQSWKLQLENVSSISFDSNQILFVNNNSLYGFDGRRTFPLQIFPSNKNTFFFLQKINNKVYGFTKNVYPYVFLLDNNSATPINILKPGFFIQDINVIDDEVWISTSTGAYCFNKQWQPKYNGHCFFNESSITKIVKDREDNYWFSTLNKGIIIVPNINVHQYKFFDESITAITTDGNNILAGTSNHRLLSFSAESNLFASLYKEQSNHEIISLFYDKELHQTVFCSDRIGVVNGTKKIFEQLNAGKSIAKINDDFYAVAYGSGISLIRSHTNESQVPQWLQQPFATWELSQYSLLNIASRGRYVLFNKKDSTLYAATSNGLFFFSPKGKGKITCAGKDIYASQLTISNDGIYISTFSDGLYRLKGINEAEKISNNNISSTIYKLQSVGNSLWMIGDEALQQYNTSTSQLINYTYANGLPKAEFKDILLKDGKVFLATTEGLVVFEQALNNTNKTPPLLAINKFYVNKKPVDWKQQLELKSNENDIEISFSLLSFKSSDNAAKVEYKINDGSWQIIPSNIRLLSLPSLSSGNYKLQLRAFNEDGIQTEKETIFSFSIATPFYKTWWFVTLMILLGMALVYIVFTFRIKIIQQKSQLLSQKIKLEQELQQSMLSSIKSQMNPHFLFNALNTIQSYIYTNDKENASQYLGKFSELTRLILDMSNKEIVAISEEIKALKIYLELEQLRFEDKLHYQFSIDENISTETSYIPSMLIQPYVENAIKHGLLHKKNDWQLKLFFNKKDNGVFVVVDDNGIGRKRSEELNKNKRKNHQSFALNANQKRLEILNKGLKNNISLEIVDKHDVHGNAVGTTVRIFIPFAQKGSSVSAS